jgi:hypothetical protein
VLRTKLAWLDCYAINTRAELPPEYLSKAQTITADGFARQFSCCIQSLSNHGRFNWLDIASQSFNFVRKYARRVNPVDIFLGSRLHFTTLRMDLDFGAKGSQRINCKTTGFATGPCQPQTSSAILYTSPIRTTHWLRSFRSCWSTQIASTQRRHADLRIRGRAMQ